MLPGPVLRTGQGKKISKGMQGPLRIIKAALFNTHDQRFGVNPLKGVPRRWLRMFAQGKSRGLRQGRIFRLQTVLERQTPVAQGFGAVRLAGQKPQAVLRQPVFQQAGRFQCAARQQAGSARVQRFFEGIAIVFANAAFGEHAVETLTGGQSFPGVQRQRTHGQKRQFVAALKRTLVFSVEKTHLVQGVAKKFQPHRACVAGRINIKNIAAPGHLAGARDHGDAFVPPLHRLLKKQLGRVIAAFGKLKRAGSKKVHWHVAQQQAFNADDDQTGPSLRKGVHGGKPRGP